MDPNGRQRRKGNPVHGWVVLDKAYNIGSTPMVGKVRWLFSAQKAGHAGTLDPLATGILPIALGEATKTVPFHDGRREVLYFRDHMGARPEQRRTRKGR